MPAQDQALATLIKARCAAAAIGHHEMAEDEPKGTEHHKFHTAASRALAKAAAQAGEGNYAKPSGLPDEWLINSRSGAGEVYIVNTATFRCTCANGGRSCWHMQAALVASEITPVAA